MVRKSPVYCSVCRDQNESQFSPSAIAHGGARLCRPCDKVRHQRGGVTGYGREDPEYRAYLSKRGIERFARMHPDDKKSITKRATIGFQHYMAVMTPEQVDDRMRPVRIASSEARKARMEFPKRQRQLAPWMSAPWAQQLTPEG